MSSSQVNELEENLADLGFGPISVRLKNGLINKRIATLEELVLLEPYDFIKVTFVGRKTIRELIQVQSFLLQELVIKTLAKPIEDDTKWDLWRALRQLGLDEHLAISCRLEKLIVRLQISSTAQFLALDSRAVSKIPNVGKETIRELKYYQRAIKKQLLSVLRTGDTKEPNADDANQQIAQANPKSAQILKTKKFSKDEIPYESTSKLHLNLNENLLGELYFQALHSFFDEIGSQSRNLKFCCLRYGFGDETLSPQTLQQIGDQFGVSRERVRQVLKRQVPTLRRRFSKNEFTNQREEIVGTVREFGRQRGVTDAEAVALLTLSKFDWPNKSYAKLLSGVFLTFGMFRGKEKEMAVKSAKIILERLKVQKRELERIEALDRLFADRSLPVAKKGQEDLFIRSVRKPNFSQKDIDEDFEEWRGFHYAGKFFSKKNSRDVFYDSRLERRLLTQLESTPSVIRYREQPVEIDYLFQNQYKTYVPDVAIDFGGRDHLLLEIKPPGQLVTKLNLLKYDAGYSFAKTMGVSFLVCDDRGRSLRYFYEREVPTDLASEFLNLLKKDELVRWPPLKTLFRKYNCSSIFIASLALQHELCIEYQPWRLTRLNYGPSLKAQFV